MPNHERLACSALNGMFYQTIYQVSGIQASHNIVEQVSLWYNRAILWVYALWVHKVYFDHINSIPLFFCRLQFPNLSISCSCSIGIIWATQNGLSNFSLFFFDFCVMWRGCKWQNWEDSKVSMIWVPFVKVQNKQ